MRVLKFGGSSVGSPEKIEDVKNIIESNKAPVIVVVSAFKSITDQLVQTGQMAASGNGDYLKKLKEIKQRHLKVIEKLTPENRASSAKEKTASLLRELEDTLHGIQLLQELTLRTQDHLLSFGERLSATIISHIVDDAEYLDIREYIRTDSNHGNAQVNFPLTYEILPKVLKSTAKTLLVPGFIGKSDTGITTTLGRGGSDYTASIIAGAIKAEILEIWTDVDGFMTADPNKVEKAYAVAHLTYSEAMELSHFGAKVIYTPTIQPVYQRNIPLVIKNTFNPRAPGTLISNKRSPEDTNLIKGISSIDNIDLVTLQGIGLVGVTGISARLFSALAKANVNIIMITQASSEYSITFAISPGHTEKAIVAIKEEFLTEIELKKNIKVHLEKELSVIAIVGEQMKNTPGISATMFKSLGRNGISVIATAQGSSELNISVVIKQKSLKKALNVIHEGFFLSHYKELHLFLVGTGTVGKSLISQIAGQQQKLKEEHLLKVNVVGIANSRKMIVEKKCLNLNHHEDIMDKLGEPTDMKKFVDQVKKLNYRNSVFIDCTADDKIPDHYKKIFESYASVVTANKVACSSTYALYRELKKTAQDKNVRFSYETNVGAGLPIINTINDLMKSGDRILRMEAVLSGTLNFIFNVIDADIPLSKAVKMAKEKGYSEPDPRVDLSGIDVMRKLLILSRESGYPVEQENVKSKPFLPDECFKGSIDDFWKEIEKFDEPFEKERKRLEKDGKRWRYVAILDEGETSVELREIDIHHPAYALEGSNNIIVLTTERYREHPMVIKGYGAGAEVTAAGVFADVIRIANV
jgi:aspartokinase/homoserine dehydrogenase 1